MEGKRLLNTDMDHNKIAEYKDRHAYAGGVKPSDLRKLPSCEHHHIYPHPGNACPDFFGSADPVFLCSLCLVRTFRCAGWLRRKKAADHLFVWIETGFRIRSSVLHGDDAEDMEIPAGRTAKLRLGFDLYGIGDPLPVLCLCGDPGSPF